MRVRVKSNTGLEAHSCWGLTLVRSSARYGPRCHSPRSFHLSPALCGPAGPSTLPGALGNLQALKRRSSTASSGPGTEPLARLAKTATRSLASEHCLNDSHHHQKKKIKLCIKQLCNVDSIFHIFIIFILKTVWGN